MQYTASENPDLYGRVKSACAGVQSRLLARGIATDDVLPKTEIFTSFLNEAGMTLTQFQQSANKKLTAELACRLWSDYSNRITIVADRIRDEHGSGEDSPDPEPDADPEPTPVPEIERKPEPAPSEVRTDADAKLAALQELLGLNKPQGPTLTDEDIAALKDSIRRDLVAEFGRNGGQAQRIEIVSRDDPDKPEDIGVQHAGFPLLMAAIRSGVNVAMPGPAGSGKTTAAMHAAKALGQGFTSISCNPVMTPGQVIGVRTADGGFSEGPLIRAMRGGDVFLADEFDKMRGDLAPMLNAALANREIGLPTGELLKAHEKTVFINAMNTYGTGATDLYASQRQDAATMDRFFFIDWQYDPQLEAAMIGVKTRIKGPDYSLDRGGLLGTKDAWFRYVQQVRSTLEKENIKHVVSPRASLMGCLLASEGIGIHWLIEGLVMKGLKESQREKIAKATESHVTALTA